MSTNIDISSPSGTLFILGDQNEGMFLPPSHIPNPALQKGAGFFGGACLSIFNSLNHGRQSAPLLKPRFCWRHQCRQWITLLIGAIERDGKPLECGFIPIVILGLGFDLQLFPWARRLGLLLHRHFGNLFRCHAYSLPPTLSFQVSIREGVWQVTEIVTFSLLFLEEQPY